MAEPRPFTVPPVPPSAAAKRSFPGAEVKPLRRPPRRLSKAAETPPAAAAAAPASATSDAAAPTGPVRWQVKADQGWVNYDAAITSAIEAGYQRSLLGGVGSSQATPFTFRGVPYEADFSCSPMLQKRKDGILLSLSV